jgi:hypothetical protein
MTLDADQHRALDLRKRGAFAEGRQLRGDPRRETAKLSPRQVHQFVDCQALALFGNVLI